MDFVSTTEFQKLHFFTFTHWSLRSCFTSEIIVTAFAVAGENNRILYTSFYYIVNI